MSPERFQDAISRDWLWREKELREMDARILIRTSKVGLKAGLLLVYSHWEGHFRVCAGHVLNFMDEGIKRKTFKWTQLKEEVRCRIIFCSYRRSGMSGMNQETFIGYLNALNDSRYTAALKASDDIVMIDSNLNAERAEAICRNLGVRHSWCALKKVIIDERILAYRNAFAHGSEKLKSGDLIDFSRSDIADAISEARILIRETKDNFSNCIAQREFLFAAAV